MTKDEIKLKIEELKLKEVEVKKEVDYYNALQLALKLVLNGSYGAFAASYFVLFNNHVAGTITAQGRDVIKHMEEKNNDYWYNHWVNDTELHKSLCIKNVRNLRKRDIVSTYIDTDSLFVSFKAAIDSCEWQNLGMREDFLSSIKRPFVILTKDKINVSNPNLKSICNIVKKRPDNMTDVALEDIDGYDLIIVDGSFTNDREYKKYAPSIKAKIIYNWQNETDFIHGLNYLKYQDYINDVLEDYASKFGVDNRHDFELERISESIIFIAKKKYIMNISFEDGIPYDKLTYMYPKGVELIRSSTPFFAREKIVNIIKYLFRNPETFNIKDLVKLVKELRREFELAPIDDISSQSSCSNYESKVLSDKLPFKFADKTHFGVKASAYYNYLISQSEDTKSKYEPIKSGTKIKYYYCKDATYGKCFAFHRGAYPFEVAPQIDYDIQFEKSILSPINTIIKPLGLPQITKRLTVIMDIFGCSANPSLIDDEDESEELYDVKYDLF